MPPPRPPTRPYSDGRLGARAAVQNARRRRDLNRRRAAHRRLRLLLLAVTVLGVALAGAVWAAPRLLATTCSTSALQPIALGTNSFVTASDGSLLGVIPSTANRQPTPLWQMSKWLPAATIAVEDRRFWHHGALDYTAIARSAFAALLA